MTLNSSLFFFNAAFAVSPYLHHQITYRYFHQFDCATLLVFVLLLPFLQHAFFSILFFYFETIPETNQENHKLIKFLLCVLINAQTIAGYRGFARFPIKKSSIMCRGLFTLLSSIQRTDFSHVLVKIVS